MQPVWSSMPSQPNHGLSATGAMQGHAGAEPQLCGARCGSSQALSPTDIRHHFACIAHLLMSQSQSVQKKCTKSVLIFIGISGTNGVTRQDTGRQPTASLPPGFYNYADRMLGPVGTRHIVLGVPPTTMPPTCWHMSDMGSATKNATAI